MSTPVLRVENITMQFGGVIAVNNFSMEIHEGEIVALIGPNGAGKTTAFNCITGVYEPTNGKVEFCGKPIVENYPHGKMRKFYAGENRGLYYKRIAHTPDYITKMGPTNRIHFGNECKIAIINQFLIDHATAHDIDFFLRITHF